MEFNIGTELSARLSKQTVEGKDWGLGGFGVVFFGGGVFFLGGRGGGLGGGGVGRGRVEGWLGGGGVRVFLGGEGVAQSGSAMHVTILEC